MSGRAQQTKETIRDYIGHYYRAHLASPTVREIAAGTGIPKTSVQRYLVEMDSEGLIRYDGSAISTSQTVKCISEYCSAPLMGAIPCGEPESEEADILEYVNLPRSIFGAGELYVLRAEGNSMEDAGIEEGDFLVIRQQQDARVGDIVVALDQEHRNTLKRYGGIDPIENKAILQYQNHAVYGDRVILVDELVCQGVLSHVIKAR